MDGIILVNKPKDWTSFDVVNRIRRIIQNSEYNITNKKRYPVGHTGTLDPLATGLLVVLVGKYTKNAEKLSKLDKEYDFTMMLGTSSSTGDEEGEKTRISSRCPELSEIKATINKLTGEIQQTPHKFSAIKINGKKAYELARKGQEVKLEPRKVRIEKLEINSYEYPNISLSTKVSSGTYIRSLVEDIGEKLETGAYMTSLNRTKVGDFSIKNSITMEGIDIAKISKALMTLD